MWNILFTFCLFFFILSILFVFLFMKKDRSTNKQTVARLYIFIWCYIHFCFCKFSICMHIRHKMKLLSKPARSINKFIKLNFSLIKLTLTVYTPREKSHFPLFYSDLVDKVVVSYVRCRWRWDIFLYVTCDNMFLDEWIWIEKSETIMIFHQNESFF